MISVDLLLVYPRNYISTDMNFLHKMQSTAV